MSELEIFRSKDEPEQLWTREIAEDGADQKNDFVIYFIHEKFHFLMDEHRADEIPEYAVTGTVRVSPDSKVIQAFEPNENFDAVKVAAYKLK